LRVVSLLYADALAMLSNVTTCFRIEEVVGVGGGGGVGETAEDEVAVAAEDEADVGAVVLFDEDDALVADAAAVALVDEVVVLVALEDAVMVALDDEGGVEMVDTAKSVRWQEHMVTSVLVLPHRDNPDDEYASPVQ
jgi:hypothetical protein